jgi:hypothetical protein
VDRASVRAAYPEDIELILELADESDLKTLRDYFEDTPESVLRAEIYSDRTIMAGLIDKRLVCLFGCHSRTLLDDELVVWLLGTEELRKHPVLFMKHCMPILRTMSEGYSKITAMGDSRNKRNMAWLKRIGFHVTGEIKSPRGLKFPLMELKEKSWLS